MTENASIPGNDAAGPIKRADAIAASALPTTKLTNPFEFEEPGGKTKNPQDSDFELKYMTPKTIQMFKIIFNVLPGRLA